MSRRIGIASLLWGLAILLSRVVGLFREATIGRVLGGGAQADLYLASFTLPDILYQLLAGGALSVVFIPIFGGYLARGEEEKGWQAASVIATALLLLFGVSFAAMWIAAPELVGWLTPGFDATQTAALVRLTRIMLPAQLFHLLGGLLSATLQARDKHTLAALAPLVYTGCIIAGGLIGGASSGAEGFAWGVVVGSVLGPFGLPLYGCLQTGLKLRLDFRFNDPDLKLWLVRTLPVMLGWSIVVVDDWFLRRQGSLLHEGAIATVQYAKTLMRVPMGVFGFATGVAAFPTLTRLYAQGKGDEAYATLSGAVRRMLVLAFASQVALTVAGPEIAQVIYGGRISAAQHQDIGVALALTSLGLWAWAAQTVVARGFWAMGRTWGPTLVGTAIAAAAYPLYPLLGQRWGTAGLSVASTVAISVYVVVLIVWLRRSAPGVADGYLGFFARMIPAVGLGIGAGAWVRTWLDVPLPLVRGALLVAVGVAVYGAVALALRLPDAVEVLGLIRARVRRRRA